MSRKAIAAIAAISLLGLSAACGGDNSATPTSAETPPSTTEGGTSFTNENWSSVITDPKSHKGATVLLVGRVFQIQRDPDGTYMQVWVGQNNEQNTIVAVRDPDFPVSNDDYIRASGTVGDAFEGKNAFGADLTVPRVIADSVEIVDATAAALPPHTTYGKSSSKQAGVTVTVSKIEASSNETRIYIQANNRSASNFSFYASSAKLVANGRSIQTSYGGDYPEPASDIPAHSRTSGVILFESIPEDASLRLIVEGYSRDSNVGDYGSLTWTFIPLPS